MTRNDYAGWHQTPASDEPNMSDLTTAYPDVYTRPELYHGGDDAATLQAITTAHGNPTALITIYRAAPPEVRTINTGDWVTTSPEYAKQHGSQDDNPAHDWPVISATARAGELTTECNSLQEWAYHGPTIQEQD